MKHRLNGHHTNDGINISSKRCVTSAANPKFAQVCGVLGCELRVQKRHYKDKVASVLIDSEVRTSVPQMLTNSGIGTLVRRQAIGGETLMPRHSRRTALTSATTHLLVRASSSPSSSPPTRHRRPHHRQSPHRRFFVSGLFVYLFPRIEGRPIGRGRPTFRAFGKQLAALFAKILAFQAIILAF
jgi:hypothetical protein